MMRRVSLTRALRRHWQPAVVTVVSGLLVAALVHPDWGVRDYEATQVVYSPAAARANGSASAPLVDPFILKPDAIAALATSTQTANRAAQRLGYDGAPLGLLRRVAARADASAGTIAITARRHGDPRGAVAIANAVATELVALVDESRAAARDRAIDNAKAQTQQLQDEISALAPADPLTPAKKTELGRRYAEAAAEVDQLTNAAPTSGISTIRPAEASAVSDNSLRALPPVVGWSLTLLLLAVLGGSVAVASELTDDRLGDARQAATSTGAPVLAMLPVEDAGEYEAGTGGAPAPDEAYRRLLRALLTRGRAVRASRAGGSVDAGHLFLFTSAAEDEPPTEAVIGVATTVSASGRRTVIVDCDDGGEGEGTAMRRGLGDIAGEGDTTASLASVAQATAIPRVSLVPRGDPTQSAVALLLARPELLERARADADVIIVHAPSVRSAPNDVSALSQRVDDVALVCRQGTTRTPAAAKAIAQLRAGGSAPGLVLTGGSVEVSGAPGALVERLRTDTKLRGRAEWAGAAVAMLVLYLLLRAFIFESFSIPTASMSPYLRPGDRVLVSKLSYHLHAVHRGDVVVFDPPKTAVGLPREKLIKRVIGLPGEVVESRDGHVFINDKQLPERYLNASVVSANVSRQTIPAGRYWVMGDNRGNSADSRFFGTITRGSIVGRAFFHLWPTPIGLM